MHPQSEKDYQAEADLDAITRAQEVEKDAARLARVKTYAERRREEFAQVVNSLPGKPSRRFNSAVRGSKMERKS
jgi:pyruvate dehydrogenase complex dehydrogenase (E1) component